MCLIVFAFGAHPRYRLIVAANRDEWFHRPTATAGFWSDAPDVLAGRDLEQQGTWFGFTRTGRFAALTNYREPGAQRPDAPSRGRIVSEFLQDRADGARYVDAMAAAATPYNGFNLLVGSLEPGPRLSYYSNRGPATPSIEPGVHGLSNHLLNTAWPKVESSKARLRELLRQPSIESAGLFDLLGDPAEAADHALPATGVPLPWERALSAVRIQPYRRDTPLGERFYGTRSASTLIVDRDGAVTFSERSFGLDGTIEHAVSESFRL
jgi:uncharacterized protein with NRDE domain